MNFEEAGQQCPAFSFGGTPSWFEAREELAPHHEGVLPAFSFENPPPYISLWWSSADIEAGRMSNRKSGATFAAILPVQAFHQTTLPPYVQVPSGPGSGRDQES